MRRANWAECKTLVQCVLCVCVYLSSSCSGKYEECGGADWNSLPSQATVNVPNH